MNPSRNLSGFIMKNSCMHGMFLPAIGKTYLYMKTSQKDFMIVYWIGCGSVNFNFQDWLNVSLIFPFLTIFQRKCSATLKNPHLRQKKII